MSALAAAILLLGCTAVDGDTLRCGSEKFRLLAIDAPEIPGHCRPGRNCAPGDPFRAQRTLAAAVQGKQLSVVRVRVGAWGRTDALVYADGELLSCLQLRTGNAVYWRRYDFRQSVRRECKLP